jgi:hypothetical protein
VPQNRTRIDDIFIESLRTVVEELTSRIADCVKVHAVLLIWIVSVAELIEISAADSIHLDYMQG